MTTSPHGPDPSGETVSVILRRQVPPDFEKPSHSWFGGLPALPDGVGWPRATRPLHFVAQISCADLPPDLWNRAGPREGWLVVFLAPLASRDDPTEYRVLHVSGDVHEREAPADLPPVVDARALRFEDADPMHLCGADPTGPQTWPRWPVDAVPVPTRHPYLRRVVAEVSPLYEGDASLAFFEFPEIVPFTHALMREALSFIVDAVGRIRDYRSRHEASLEALTPEVFEVERTRLRETIASLAMHDDPEIVRRRKERERTLALIDAYPSADALRKHMARTPERLASWRANALDCLERVRAAIPDDDTPLPEDAWRTQAGALREEVFEYLYLLNDGQPHLAVKRLCVFDYFYGHAPGMFHIFQRYYLDPARHGMIPIDLRTAFEDWARRYLARPHRMGGSADWVHGMGPNEPTLLLQLASDAAMGWYWGLRGTHYLFVPHESLRQGDLSAVWGERHSYDE